MRLQCDQPFRPLNNWMHTINLPFGEEYVGATDCSSTDADGETWSVCARDWSDIERCDPSRYAQWPSEERSWLIRCR